MTNDPHMEKEGTKEDGNATEATPLRALASQIPKATGAVSVKHYDLESDDYGMKEGIQNDSTKSLSHRSNRPKLKESKKSNLPKIKFHGALLSGEPTYHNRNRIKSLGGTWIKSINAWALLPVDGPKSELVQKELDQLELAGVHIEWIGEYGQTNIQPLIELQNLVTSSRKIRTQEKGETDKEPIKTANSESAPGTNSSTHSGESLDQARREDPWKGTSWARINLESLGQFLQGGIKERKLDAAHFKVFLLLITRMNESNVIDSTQDDMAKTLNLKPSRFSEVIKDLAEMGLIQRLNHRKKNACIRISPYLLIMTKNIHHRRLIEYWDRKDASPLLPR